MKDINWDKVLREISTNKENRIAMGAGIRKMRQDSGLSPSELCETLNIEESDLGLIETGEKPVDQNAFFTAGIWFLEGMENAGEEFTEQRRLALLLSKLFLSGNEKQTMELLEFCHDLGKEIQEEEE